MNKKQLETASKVIEHLNRKERLSGQSQTFEVNSEVVEVVMKTYQEQGIPKSVEEVREALEEIMSPGLEKPTKTPLPDAELPFYSSKRIVTPQIEVEWWPDKCKCKEVAAELTTHLLAVKPYSDSERSQHLKNEIEEGIVPPPEYFLCLGVSLFCLSGFGVWP